MSTKNIDNAVSEYVKANADDNSFITGWVAVVSVSSLQHDTENTDGYITVASDGLSHHVQIGLLDVAIADKKNNMLISTLHSFFVGNEDED